jgi:hypothetical protein
MSALGILLRIARSVVLNIIQVIIQQIRLTQDIVTDPLRVMVQAVTGGVWRGEGANRFADEMTSQVIPSLITMGSVMTSFGSTITKSIEIMDQAERKATQQAQQLYDVFNSIYR